MEFSKTAKPSETIINYKLFEPKQEQKEKIDFEKEIQESKKRLQEDAERIKKTSRTSATASSLKENACRKSRTQETLFRYKHRFPDIKN